MHKECKYCDCALPPDRYGDDYVCCRCGANWDDAAQWVSDEEER